MFMNNREVLALSAATKNGERYISSYLAMKYGILHKSIKAFIAFERAFFKYITNTQYHPKFRVKAPLSRYRMTRLLG